MHPGRPNHWSQKHFWITREFGSFGFASGRMISKMNLLKISGLREPPGRLEDQAQELGRNTGRQCIKSLASIHLQNGPVGILLLPTCHCDLHGCWCWTLIFLEHNCYQRRIIFCLIPYCQQLLFLWLHITGEPSAHISLCSTWKGCWEWNVSTLPLHYYRRSYTEGNSPNRGRPFGPPKTWPISTIRSIFF